MFKVLLNDARSRDVIQTSFDTLTDHLEGLGTAKPHVFHRLSLDSRSQQARNA